MDTTYLSKQEIKDSQPILCTCPNCGNDGKLVSEITQYRNILMCDGCYIVVKQEEIGILHLHVSRDLFSGWQVTKNDWDLGDIIAYGDTIQLAIEDFFEQLTMKHDIDAKYLQHQYTWS